MCRYYNSWIETSDEAANSDSSTNTSTQPDSTPTKSCLDVTNKSRCVNSKRCYLYVYAAKTLYIDFVLLNM